MLMLTHNIHSATFFSLFCLINKCLCVNFSVFQGVLSVDEITNHLANAVAKVGNTHFIKNGPVVLFGPPKEDKSIILEIFERLLHRLSQLFSVITVDKLHFSGTAKFQPSFSISNVASVLQKPDIYIIPMKEKKEFQTLDNVLKKLNLWETFNPAGLFVIIKTIVECGSYSEYNVSSQYFAKLWKKNCLNVVLLVLSECDLQLTVVTGKPFSKENPCRIPEIGGLRFNHFNSSDGNITLNISKTKTKNFNGCVFTAGIVPAPPFVVAKAIETDSALTYSFVGGMEIEIKDVLSKKFNFSVNLDVSNGYQVSSLLRRFKNGTETGIATDMRNHQIDFALGGVSPNYRTFFMYDFSHSYKHSSFSWYVPNPNVAPRWQIIFKTLSLGVWISSAAMFLLVSILYVVMELHNYKLRNRSKIAVTSITFIELLCVGLGLSATQQPRGCVKVLFISWALFGLHWNMAYSTTLFDLLSTPPLEKEILTIQDLKDSGLKVVSPALYFQIFSGVSIDSVTRSVLNNKVDCTNLNLCIKQFVMQRNVSLMDRSEHVDYSVNFKVSKIHKLSENLISFGVSLMSNKGNPLSPVINEVATRVFETGLVNKWETDTAWKFNYEKNTMESFSDQDSSLPLSVTVLQGAFFLLIAGIFLSLLMFLGELLVSHYKK